MLNCSYLSGCIKLQGDVRMNGELCDLAAALICATNITETNIGLIDFIASTLQSPVSALATLRSQQDHHEG